MTDNVDDRDMEALGEGAWRYLRDEAAPDVPEAAADEHRRLQATAEWVREALAADAAPAEQFQDAHLRLLEALEDPPEAPTLAPRRLIQSLRSRWRLAWVTAAAALILAAIGVAWIQARGRVEAVSPASLAADYRKTVASPNPMSIRSNDPQSLAAEVSRQVGFPVRALDLPAEVGRLLGGQKCEVDGHTVAITLAESGQWLVTCYQFSDPCLALPPLDAHLVDGQRFLACAEGDLSIVMWRDADDIFAVVSDLDVYHVLDFAREARGAMQPPLQRENPTEAESGAGERPPETS